MGVAAVRVLSGGGRMGTASSEEVVEIEESFVCVEREDEVEALRSSAVSRRRARAAGKADEGVGGVDGLEGRGEWRVAAILYCRSVRLCGCKRLKVQVRLCDVRPESNKHVEICRYSR